MNNKPLSWIRKYNNNNFIIASRAYFHQSHIKQNRCNCTMLDTPAMQMILSCLPGLTHHLDMWVWVTTSRKIMKHGKNYQKVTSFTVEGQTVLRDSLDQRILLQILEDMNPKDSFPMYALWIIGLRLLQSYGIHFYAPLI